MEKVSKRQDGISLVALIVTIIVMVILAGIIITAAVADGGVIDRAKESLVQQERADVQEIIIGSYVFKTTASSETFKYLDLKKTGIAIYQNLDANDFTLEEYDEVDEDGKKVRSAPLLTDSEGNISGIEATVKGDYGEYNATLDKEGLNGEIEIIGGGGKPPKPQEKTDLEKLREYFVGNIVLNFETYEGLVDTQKLKFKEKEGVLTQEEAESIVFTPLTNPPEVGKTATIPLEFNGKTYILILETVEIEAQLAIKGKSVDVSEPSLDDLELLRKCMMKENNENSEITEEMIGTEQTFTHPDGDSVTVNFDTTLFMNSETEYMLKIIYNKAQYILTIIPGENEGEVKISDVNYIESKDTFKYNEYYISDIPMAETYIGTYSQAAIKVNKNGDMQLYCVDTMELSQEMPQAIKIYGNKVYMNSEGMYYAMGTLSEDGKTFTLTIDTTTITFTIGDIPPPDTRVIGCYELKVEEDGEVAGAGVLINENKTGFMYMAMDDVRVFPFYELMAIEGEYEFNLNGGTKTVINPVFKIDQRYLMDKNPRKIKTLIGAIVNGKFVSINVEHDSSDSNIDENDFIKVYKKIKYSTEQVYPRNEEGFKYYENLDCEKRYIQEDATEDGKSIIAFVNEKFEIEDEEGNKTTETRSVIYQGMDYKLFGMKFWVYGPIEYEIREDFVATLTDGTTVDYSGKKVIIAEQPSSNNFEGNENRIVPFGYYQGDKIVIFDADVSEWGDNGVASKFDSIEEVGRMILD